MPALSKADMLKTAGKGPYSGQTRVDIMSFKIRYNKKKDTHNIVSRNI